MGPSKDKITLYRGFANSNNYVWSPFVTKLEFRFRYSKLPYRIEKGSPREGPNNKIPYIDASALRLNDSSTSEPQPDLIADSSLIIAKLVKSGHLDDLNGRLSPQQKAMDLALKALFEEKLYFFTMSERWIDHYYIHRDKILETESVVMKWFKGIMIHRFIRQTLYCQGSGRFSAEEQKAFRQEVWESLEAILSEQRRKAKDDKPFWCLGGERPTEADAAVFAFTSSALICNSSPDTMAFVKALPSVVDYAKRIHNSLFPDYEKWTA